MTEHTVICHTAGCENDGIPIVMGLMPGTSVTCGPCEEPITDVVPPVPDGDDWIEDV